MAKDYEVTSGVLRTNKLMKWMSRRGIGRTAVLTTVGRVSGESRPVPVSPIEHGGREFLVAPYGDMAWVLNVRANNQVTIRKGGSERSCTLTEVTGDANEVVAAYYAREGFARPFMEVPDDPSIGDFEAAATLFPVFVVS